jgi:hypothetical protein
MWNLSLLKNDRSEKQVLFGTGDSWEGESNRKEGKEGKYVQRTYILL